MRILVISYEYPPVGGGGSDACLHIARELAARGHVVRILTAHCPGLPFHEKAHGFEVRRIRSFRKQAGGCTIPEMFGFVSLACLHSIGECRRFRPDLIHVHHAVPDGPAGLFLQSLFRIPYVVSTHGGDIPGHIPDLVRVFRRIHFVCRRIWRRAGANVVVGNHLLGLARKAYPDARLIVIPNGVDTDVYRPLPGYAIERPRDGEVRILYAGRFHPEKNIPALIRAMAHVQSQTEQPFRLILFGSGKEEAALKRLAEENGLAERVDFPGWVSREDIIAAFQRGHLFVLPSLAEGMPISCIQAMACGLPVVASDLPGIRMEVVPGETGLLVPPGESGLLAEAILCLMQQPELRKQMGAAGRKRCEDMFGWHTIGDQYEKLFLQVLGRNGSGRSAIN